MTPAATPAAITVRQVDATLNPRGGIIEIPAADGVSTKLFYPANDIPPAERVHIEAVGPAGAQILGVEPFGGNRNYAPFYQLKIVLTGPTKTVHLYGSPKLAPNMARPGPPDTHYDIKITLAEGYNIQMAADMQGPAPQFSLDAIPSIFHEHVIAIRIAATLEGRIRDALAKLATYQKSRSLDDLQTAVYAMQSTLDLDQSRLDTFVAQRRAFIAGWAKVFRVIENSYDPTFDPKKRLPCPVARFNNELIPGGCDPRLVNDPQDPAVRSKELQDLNVYEANYDRYSRVQQLDDQAMTIVQMSLDLMRKVAPNGTPSNFAALDATLRNAGLSDARRHKIDKWFYARQGPCQYIGLWNCK